MKLHGCLKNIDFDYEGGGGVVKIGKFRSRLSYSGLQTKDNRKIKFLGVKFKV